MAKRFRIQFLATHGEMLSWAREWQSRWGLVVVSVLNAPAISLASWDGVRGDFGGGRVPDRLVFFSPGITPALTSPESFKGMLQAVDWAALDFGEQTTVLLRESSLSGYASTPEMDCVWRRLVKDIRGLTTAGGWVISGLGERFPSASLRYTEEAARAQRGGLVLKAFAGEVEYEVATHDR